MKKGEYELERGRNVRQASKFAWAGMSVLLLKLGL